MSGHERKTKDYVSFIALFLFDIFWLKLGSIMKYDDDKVYQQEFPTESYLQFASL